MISRRLWPGLGSLFLVALLSGCAATTNVPAPSPPLLLISMDGFRWDYLDRYPEQTPNLHALRKSGVGAKALIPVFPSQTFVNHYSIVTGLYPSHHGIINNVFFDAELSEFFRYKTPSANKDPRWWKGEPIWITAVRQGKRSACYFWPGSEVAMHGLRATISKPFDYGIPFEKRADELFGWLRLPAEQRPAITTFYFEETNKAAHYFGIDSPELIAAVAKLDAQIGSIVDRAKREGLALNIVVVSDHGFVETSGEKRTTMLDDFVDFERVQVDFDGPVTGLRPLDGNVDSVVQRLSSLPPQYKIYRSAELPAHLHVTPGARVPPIWIIPDPGWRIQRRSTFLAVKDNLLKGDHGFDPASESMHGILIASGPSFKTNGDFGRVENIHVYNLLCAALGLRPAANDGDNRLIRAMLR
ncbi:MAG: ectonucleotide pyrophosphatase/phosphodiesterase [Opitutus sp.]